MVLGYGSHSVSFLFFHSALHLEDLSTAVRHLACSFSLPREHPTKDTTYSTSSPQFHINSNILTTLWCSYWTKPPAYTAHLWLEREKETLPVLGNILINQEGRKEKGQRVAVGLRAGRGQLKAKLDSASSYWVLPMLRAISLLISSTLSRRYYYSHFTDKETECRDT